MERKLSDGLAIFASLYAKRLMDSHVYDRLFETELGRSLRSLGPASKHSIEAGLYVLTAFLDQMFVDDTSVRKFVAEIARDVGPEVAKRMINGVRHEIKLAAKTPDERQLAAELLALDSESLTALLTWYDSTNLEDRQRLLSFISQLNREHLSALAKLDSEQRTLLMKLAGTPQPDSENGLDLLRTSPIADAATVLRRWTDRIEGRNKRT